MKQRQIMFRVSKDEKDQIVKNSKDLGFKNLSDYIRFVCLNANVKISATKKD